MNADTHARLGDIGVEVEALDGAVMAGILAVGVHRHHLGAKRCANGMGGAVGVQAGAGVVDFGIGKQRHIGAYRATQVAVLGSTRQGRGQQRGAEKCAVVHGHPLV